MIQFCKSYIGEEEKNAVKSVLDSGWLTQGQKVQEFEEKFAEYVGAKYAIAVNSCTSALFLALQRKMQKTRYYKVILPALTFAATANIVKHSGLQIEFVDVNLEDFCFCGYAEIGVCYGGNECGIAPIIDSAHLIKKNQCKKRNSTFCYSFYATKSITTGEGGMICTNNKEDAEWFKKARLHGMSKDASKRYTDKNKWSYDVEFVGYKMNMTDIAAAIGIEQLKKLDLMEQKRTEIRQRYNKNLALNWQGNHIYPVLVENRDKVIEYLASEGIMTSVHFKPVHLMSAYIDYVETNLPNTEYIGQHEISLPIYPGLTMEDVDFISKKVEKFLIR